MWWHQCLLGEEAGGRKSAREPSLCSQCHQLSLVGLQACEQKPRELEGIKGLPAAVRRTGYCTAGREETVTQKERDGGGLWH